MQFGRWYPLAVAADHAPAGPGVFQVRARVGLVEYPRGKSAMVHYGHAADVAAAARALALAHPGTDLLCRHLVDLADASAAPRVATKLIADFSTRFGGPPSVPPQIGAGSR